MNNTRKLQVFISSTFIDLKEERQVAVQAILKSGHIPAGMELFKASDEDQWHVIKKWIEESDIFLLILAGRYGSIEPISGKSYTHLEYEYALKIQKPYFVILIDEEWTNSKAKSQGSLISDFIEIHNNDKLNDLKQKVKTKLVNFVKDLNEIKLSVIESLIEISQRIELIGWVKADKFLNLPQITEELSILSKENRLLKNKLEGNYNFEKSLYGLLKEKSIRIKENIRFENFLEFFLHLALCEKCYCEFDNGISLQLANPNSNIDNSFDAVSFMSEMYFLETYGLLTFTINIVSCNNFNPHTYISKIIISPLGLSLLEYNNLTKIENV